MLISSAQGLQKQVNILNCNKWLLKINLKKEALILLKQNRKSTRNKYTFFLNENQIANATQYSYVWALHLIQMELSLSISKQLSAEITRRSIFGAKRYTCYLQ